MTQNHYLYRERIHPLSLWPMMLLSAIIGVFIPLGAIILWVVIVYVAAFSRLSITNEEIAIERGLPVFALHRDRIKIAALSGYATTKDPFGLLLGYGHLSAEAHGKQLSLPGVKNIDQVEKIIMELKERP